MKKVGSLIRNLDRVGEIFRCARETRQWRAVTLAYLGIRKLDYPYALKLRGLEPILLKEVSDIWTFWQVFARRVYPLYGSEAQVVDAGANVGFFTLLAARELPHCEIVAIEPAPETFQRLVENVAKNGYAGRVSCLNCGLAGEEGVRAMRIVESHSQRQRLLPRGSSQVAGAEIKTATLDVVLRDIPSVDFLKMDIEGGEYEVLFGSSRETLRKIQRLIVEYHPDEGSSSELLSYLQGGGFALQHDFHNPMGYGVATLERVVSRA